MKKLFMKVTRFPPFTNRIARKKKKMTTIEPLYLQDSPVTNRKEDKFQYGQMADIIYELLEEGQLPLHIGLMGSWGTGKTSVLRLLETKVNAERKHDRKYLLKFINVWKFADDAPSLHRKIVREVEAELKVKESKSLDHTESTQESRKTTGIWSVLQPELWMKHGFIILIYVLTLIFSTILYEWIFNLKDPWALSFTSSTTLLIIMITSALLNRSGVELTYQTTKNELAIQHGDQFEHRFESAVSEYLKANKGKKLILVFDDLDRLPPKQLVAALNTIKTFLRSNQCAFIVPCDEEVLLEGISSAFSEKKMSNLSVSEFLNKTFDLQLHLPHVEKVNMRTYAKNLLIEQRVKWALDENISVDRLLGILIHTGIRTPRQVKKILNAYAFDWYLALKRDAEAGVVFLKNHPSEIAIFTVLKTDFPNYYHYVSQNPFILQKSIDQQINKIQDNEDSLPEENENPDESARLLEAFLSRVKSSIPVDPRPFIYFNNQLLNPLTGRPELERAKEYILNAQNDKFSEEFFKLTSEDMEVVLSSTLEDIDIDTIMAGNVLKLLFENPDSLKFTKEIDLNRWEKIIVENIVDSEDLLEFKILEICTGFYNLNCSGYVWEVYGRAISVEENHEELFELWTKHPKYFEMLGISKIGQDIISTLKSKDKSYIATNELSTINPDNPILRNETFDWISNLINSITSENLPEDPLATWLPIWAHKTGGILTTDLINKLLSEFSFRDESYLEGIGALWCEYYETSDSAQSDMNTLLDLMNVIEFTGFNEINLKYLSGKFEDLEYKDISKRVSKIFSTWWEEDEDRTFELMKYWRDVPGVILFIQNIFSFTLEEKVLTLATEILTNRAYYMKSRLDNIVTIVKDELIDALNNKRKTSANNIIDTLITNSLWAEKFELLTTELFPPNSEPIWLQWPETVVEDRADLLVSFLNISDELANWIVNSIFDLLKVRLNRISHAYASYRSNHTIYINIILKRLVNNDHIDWETFLERAMEEKLDSCLDTDIIDSLVISLGKKLELNNETYNEFFIEHHNVESEYHQDIAIARWDFLIPTDRKNYLEKYDSSEITKTKFGAKLTDSLETKPHVIYISELHSWSFNKDISEKIVKTIIQKVDEPKLNSWFQDSIIKIIKGIDHWTMLALTYAVRTRSDLVIPKKEILDTLLLLKDERSVLSLDIVKKDRRVANALRNSIGSLKDTYPDEVEEVKKEFNWRKL